MKSILRLLSLAAAAAVISVGCAKKPKLNLSHLRDNPAGNGNSSLTTNSLDDPTFTSGGFGPQPFIPGEPNGGLPAPGGSKGGANGAGGYGGADGTNGANAAGGAGGYGGADGGAGWQGMGQAVALEGAAENFLKNGSGWKDRVYFDFNKTDIRASERPVLDALAAYLNGNPSKVLVIEGHTDQRGTEEYNRALSERRAISIRDYLATLGVARGRMLTVGYGEDRPVIARPTSDSEFRLNRRGQFILGDKK